MANDKSNFIDSQCWETTYTNDELGLVLGIYKICLDAEGDKPSATLWALQQLAIETRWDSMKCYVMLDKARRVMELK
jgi:hypothetical protein